MGCFGCNKKYKEAEFDTYYINCTCGLSRLLPPNLKSGKLVKLAPCPKCGTSFLGRFTGDSVVEIA